MAENNWGMIANLISSEIAEYIKEGIAGVIFCRATVETIKSATPHRLGSYEVEVVGREPNDYVRRYRIDHKSEDDAAREGIDRFVEEIGALVQDNDLQ